MTIRDIAKVTNWEDVKRSIKYHYPDDHNDYEKLFLSFPNRKKKKVKIGESLVVHGGIDVNSEWFKVHGRHYLESLETGDEKQYYGINIKNEGDEQSWSLMFVDYDCLVNVPINEVTLKCFMFADILAHFIWEITYLGGEKEMKKKRTEFDKTIKSIKK